MREIKFRGQTRKLGEKVNLKGEPVPSNWVYGGIFQGVERSVIYDGETYEKHTVYNETVGQYTGLKDKNGREIYEGDIVLQKESELLELNDLTEFKGEVKLTECEWVIDDGFEDYSLWNELALNEVIGNIHENPELLDKVK